MAKKVCKSWTESSYETIEISHVWKINGFSLRKEKSMYSLIFSSPQDISKRKWRMELYPYGLDEQSKDHLSLYLENRGDEEIEVNYSFSMHDDEGNCLQDSEKWNNIFGETAPSWGLSKFCKRDFIQNKLPSDVLKITCDLSFINVLQNVSGIEKSSKEPVLCGRCNLIENLGAMLNNNDFSDITVIILGEGEERTEFKAHKNILAARSPYFEAMFKHNFKEKAENIVEIKDVKAQVFKEILTYIYTGEIQSQNMNENDAKELFVTADRFVLDNLKSAVNNLLISKINVENASELLVLGHIHSVENLKTRAIDFVATNAKKVMKTAGWKLMIRQHPQLMEPILEAVTGSKNTEITIDSSDSD